MSLLLQLWLPILLSAVLCFVASSAIWMTNIIHKNDFKKAGAHEDGLIAFAKQSGLPVGVYFAPFGVNDKNKSPEVVAKCENGPWVQLVVMAKPSMGKSLGMWMVNLLLIGFLIAYIGAATLPAGTAYLKVFQVVGTAAFLAHAGNALTQSIWMGMPWSHVPGRVFDGVVYALLTAGVFGWLWPNAA